MPKTIAVIDGNSLMHRAYHAVPPSMNAPDGTPTNACFGFLSMLIKFIDTTSPDAVICAFDAGKPKFRIEAMEQYKAQRPHMDEELRVQFPIMEDLLQSMGIPVVKVPGWEGDDILGTVAARDEKKGYRTLLVTGDKDAYQLASPLTSIVTTKKGISDVAVYGPDEVFERYGVTPDQFPDFLGLKGDSADNIPGVPGVGDKTAAKFLSKYGSLEGLYEHLDDLKGKQLEKVRDNKDSAFLSREIATIVTDLDFPLDVEQVEWPSFDKDEVRTAFMKVGFRSHLAKVLKFEGGAEASESQALTAHKAVDPALAQQFVDDVCEHGTPVGVAYAEGQETLFGPAVMLALDDGDRAAVFDGEQALDVLARLVREGAPVALDFKELLKPVFPSDMAVPARVSDAEVLDARFFDASLAAYSLDSSADGYTLAHLCERYLSASLPEPAEPDNRDDDLLMQAAALQRLHGALLKALDEDGTRSVYEDFDAPLVGVLAIMERTGAAIDADTLERMGAVTGKEIAQVQQQIYDLAGEEFNIDSPKQVGHILFDVMGMKPLKKTTRGYSTSAAVLTKLAEDNEVPKLILHYRELAKLQVHVHRRAAQPARGRRPRAYQLQRDRDHHGAPVVQPIRTCRTSRFAPSSGASIRECFVPLAPGERVPVRGLQPDRAAPAGTPVWRRAPDAGVQERTRTSIRSTASRRVRRAQWIRSRRRCARRAKAVNFGIVYGQQAFGLSQSLHIPYGEAQEMIDRYFEAYPGVRAYLDATVEQAHGERAMPRRCSAASAIFPNWWRAIATSVRFGERTAMNHPMQGTAADIIKLRHGAGAAPAAGGRLCNAA